MPHGLFQCLMAVIFEVCCPVFFYVYFQNDSAEWPLTMFIYHQIHPISRVHLRFTLHAARIVHDIDPVSGPTHDTHIPLATKTILYQSQLGCESQLVSADINSYTYVSIKIHIHTYNMYMQMQMHMQMHIPEHMHIHIHMHIYMYIYMCVYISTDTNIDISTYLHIRVYT